MPRILSVLLMLAAPLSAATLANSQSSYPAHQLTVVVPYPPGTNADTIARLLAEKLAQAVKQTVIVENRAGGATVPGTLQMLQAPADGHALLQAGTNTNINPLLGVKTPYDAERDLVPVVLLVTFPAVLVVHPSVPVKNVSDLVSLAKSKPGSLNYGSSGSGSIFHLATEQFKQRTGTEFLHVPFRGLGPALIGLLRNDVQVMIADIPLVIDHIRAGKVHALAQTGSTRMPQLPDVPTLAEAGVTNYEAAGFLGIWTHANAPKEAVSVLNREINRALSAPELKSYAANNGIIIAGGSPADFVTFLGRDRAIWSRVIADAGIKVE